MRTLFTRDMLADGIRAGLGWGLGVGTGVALGAYLTAVGGAGAPGASTLDTSDTVILPLLSAGAAFVLVSVVHICASALAGLVRAGRCDEEHDDEERAERDRIPR